MPVYRYTQNISVGDDENVTLKVEFPDNGTAGHSIVDPPGAGSYDKVNEFEMNLGKGSDLKKERTLVLSRLVNMDIDCKVVRVNYYVNGNLIQPHSNPKSDDNPAQIVLTLNFI